MDLQGIKTTPAGLRIGAATLLADVVESATVQERAPLLAMAGQLLVDEDASPVALALLLLVFFSEWIAGHIKISGGKITRPIVLAFSGLLVVALAVGVAQWTGV